MQLTGKRVTVVGLGRSGVGAANLCARRGARVTVSDARPAEALELPLGQLDDGIARELGGHTEATFVETDLLVLSPGVPPIPPLAAARAAGVPMVGELELAYRFVQAPVIAVTGTNGKSTTTSLLGAMVQASGRPTFVGGNLGAPLVEAVGTPAAAAAGALVVEVSSFQLETVAQFRARVALLLNLSEDHLDRYPDYDSYVAAKARIFERQRADDVAVVNGEPGQQACVQLAAHSPAQCATFASDAPAGGGPAAWCEGPELCVRGRDGAVERLPRDLLALPGRHNLHNALAALLAARLFGVTLEACRRGLAGFRGLPHRMELVGQGGDVRYYNDSKATNVGSVVGSLTGFERPVVLILGGKDKGGDYAPLLPLMGQPVRQVILIGAAADRIEQTLRGGVPLERGEDMAHAVQLAAGLARPGDAVVLSPACSSFDMFQNFEHRGQVFAAAVRDWLGGAS